MSRRPGRWWKPTGPQYRRPARVSRARQAAAPEIQWAKGWDQGAHETREALDGVNAFDEGYKLGQQDAERGLDHALDVAMNVGKKEGRTEGERDVYVELNRLLEDHDFDELAATIASRALGASADWLLLIESARQKSPERFKELAEAVEQGDDAVAALADKWGVFADDDLLDVADATGVTPLADVDPAALVDDLEAWLREGGQC